MKRLNRWHSLMAVISLFVCAIWQVPASAAVSPKLSSLGRIDEGLLAAGRLDVDDLGNLYVADGRQGKVLKYDKYGRLVQTYSGFPVYAQGLAVTPDGSKLYVAGRTVVSIVDGISGQVLGRLKSTQEATGEGEFSYANEIDLDGDGNIFVVDMGTVQVKIYTPDGIYSNVFGGIGSAPYPSGKLGHGQFRSIWAMTVNPVANEVYVADNQTMPGSGGRLSTPYIPQVQVFNLSGGYLRSMTADGFANASLGVPALAMFSGMTFDAAGRGYFLDSALNNIRVRGLPTAVFPSYGVSGYAAGQLASPYDIIFDPLTNRLFVATDAGRIEVFGLDGAITPPVPVTNRAPASPVLIGPGGGGEVALSSPLLTFNNASDADKDVLTYDVLVLQDDLPVAKMLNQAEGLKTTMVEVTVPLQENGRYTWTAKAYDGQASSAWSPTETFYVNAQEEAPEPPILLEPVASQAVMSGDSQFVWEASLDRDPFDTVSYVLQVSSDAVFSSPVVDVSVGGALSASLGELAGYADLVDGATYFWQVKAVDNHGLETASTEVRSFLYDTTTLMVTANMPGARVYLGGNLAYAGRYLGEAPLELRDLVPASLSIVVEHPGFEPWVSQVVIGARDNVVIYASLVPAVSPADLKARPLTVGGSKLVCGADVVPIAVDFDNDGLIDLITGEASGELILYRGQASDQPPVFAAGEALAVTVPAGAAPVVVDWDNDGKKDLLVGTAVGTVQYYPNIGTEAFPVFAGSSYLSVAGVPLTVGGSAVPVVFDWDGDGDKDLLVGSTAGGIQSYRNIGSDSAPELVKAESLVPAVAGNAAPFVVDWNADGIRDLLVATNQHLYVYLRQSDGTFAAKSVLTVADDLVGKNGNSGNGSSYVGDRLRVFAYDADGKKGKDLLIGNAAGEVKLVRSNGKDLVPAFYLALLEKLGQIRELALDASAAVQFELDGIEAALVAGDLAVAGLKCDQLMPQVAADTALTSALAELTLLLR